MQLDSALLTVFSAEIDDHGNGPVIDLPDRELERGELEVGERYRIAIEATSPSPRSEDTDGRSATVAGEDAPVAVGDTLEVEIDDVGDEGDGIARVGPGYVVFVPDAGMGDRVTIEIQKAFEQFAFADVLEGEPIGE